MIRQKWAMSRAGLENGRVVGPVIVRATMNRETMQTKSGPTHDQKERTLSDPPLLRRGRTISF